MSSVYLVDFENVQDRWLRLERASLHQGDEVMLFGAKVGGKSLGAVKSTCKSAGVVLVVVRTTKGSQACDMEMMYEFGRLAKAEEAVGSRRVYRLVSNDRHFDRIVDYLKGVKGAPKVERIRLAVPKPQPGKPAKAKRKAKEKKRKRRAQNEPVAASAKAKKKSEKKGKKKTAQRRPNNKAERGNASNSQRGTEPSDDLKSKERPVAQKHPCRL